VIVAAPAGVPLLSPWGIALALLALSASSLIGIGRLRRPRAMSDE
jgi:hypothetical protein